MQALGHVSAGERKGKRLPKASLAPSAGEICHGSHPALQRGNLHLRRYAVQAGNQRPWDRNKGLSNRSGDEKPGPSPLPWVGQRAESFR